MNRDFKGVWIPKEIWLNEELTILDKVILIEIDSLDNEETGCIASNKYLSEFCNCTETKISTSISKLKEKGYIEQTSFDGRHRILKSRLKESLKQTLKNLKADFKKVNAINIDNNIDINNNSNSNSLFEFIESNFGRTLNYIEYELIETWEDTELTRYAIKQAILSNHCNLKYIQTILNTYHRENIQTVQQAQEREEQYKNKKNKPTVSKGWEDDFWNE